MSWWAETFSQRCRAALTLLHNATLWPPALHSVTECPECHGTRAQANVCCRRLYPHDLWRA
jgi:hypothetical protein